MADRVYGGAPDPPAYWRSVRELRDPPGVDNAGGGGFPGERAEGPGDVSLPLLSRKRFLALAAASAAFAAAGCSAYRDKGEIVPHGRKPDETTPGIADAYASTCAGCPQGCGILIRTREGRPVRVEGNPDHPLNQGKICARGQALIMDLYDPSRLRSPLRTGRGEGGVPIPWEQADGDILRHLAFCTREGKEIAVIGGGTTSPSAAALLDGFATRFPTVRFYALELFGEGNRRAAWKRCYGTADVPRVAWERADVIVALESDFLGTEGATVEHIRRFASRRDILRSPQFNRLYAVEGSMSLTAANADCLLRLRPDRQKGFVLALLAELSLVRGAFELHSSVRALAASRSLADFSARHGLDQEVLGHLVADLMAHRGSSVIHAGSRLDPDIHVLVNYLNELLGNGGVCEGAGRTGVLQETASGEDFGRLAGRMRGGEVGMVIHLDANPAYMLPPGLGYERALASVPMSVCLSETRDETSRLCTYTLPIHHAFEAWGDCAVDPGVLSLRQPVIAPLHDTRQKEAVLLRWMEGEAPFTEDAYHRYLMGRWERDVYPRLKPAVDFRSFWYGALHDGVVRMPAPPPPHAPFRGAALASIRPDTETEELLLGLGESPFLGDGRWANNGWLQELPHPVSKIVWDNYAAVSPSTARSLGVADDDLVEVKTSAGSVHVPVFLQPGLAEGYVCLSLGYGRWEAGPIGTGVGAHAGVLMDAACFTGGRFVKGVRLRPTGARQELVSTQEHHAMEDASLKDLHLKRGIIREATLAAYREDPGMFRRERAEQTSISTEVTYEGLKWGMAIDLNRCMACNACVAGCSVENNIPVVGKEQVRRGREMHWIRVDRYYAGTEENPSLSHQPMLCQHCDHAPCENVCPVVATTHSPDGLNQMTYNRCVGTKYCSNNCPYKVRRFNFFDWRDHLAEGFYTGDPHPLLMNPEVTVRSRGVMEKCTFCIQRIMEARRLASARGGTVRGDEVRTACQDACPAEAIVFGDAGDPASRVGVCQAHDLGYRVLEMLNVRPNVTYMAKLRNTPGDGSA
ncbi:MAG: molybdopterin dinucleotide binding domain-containing protein [Bacteroidota bacterium]